MRAELTIAAIGCEPNRYRLTRTIAKATRALHRPNTRLQETMNDALALFVASHAKTVSVTKKSEMVELRRAA